MITIKLDTHGYNIGDVVEFRPHCGRRKTCIGKVVSFGYRERNWISNTFEGIIEDAVLNVTVTSSPDKEDIGLTKQTGSWLSEKYCRKLNNND